MSRTNLSGPNFEPSDACLLYLPGSIHDSHPLYTEFDDQGNPVRSVISCVDGQIREVKTFDESIHISLTCTRPDTGAGAILTPDLRSLDDQRLPLTFDRNPIPANYNETDEGRILDEEKIWIPKHRWKLNRTAPEIDKMDNLTKKLIGNAMSRAAEEASTYVLECIRYVNDQAIWNFEEVENQQGEDAIPEAQVGVYVNGQKNGTIGYREARDILQGIVVEDGMS
ncbi:hypothetical protein I302_103568 [Kwoniella bestiolae CBS 10118]|uniref:Uncharacterized protein n=1 Tax=Kwoniella bestiolae CBS 10118 TaxID=1296100 RepID=A0A1B9G8S8_9TREE|nr:hypothetical protein I302_02269 [Kwoniella bestiolae CBS 10118]OCF27427.1 hypothetical protein I302_02269 [Kwoniella bestiolae CBS 10118]